VTIQEVIRLLRERALEIQATTTGRRSSYPHLEWQIAQAMAAEYNRMADLLEEMMNDA
jgi:hypothetical protein